MGSDASNRKLHIPYGYRTNGHRCTRNLTNVDGKRKRNTDVKTEANRFHPSILDLSLVERPQPQHHFVHAVVMQASTALQVACDRLSRGRLGSIRSRRDGLFGGDVGSHALTLLLLLLHHRTVSLSHARFADSRAPTRARAASSSSTSACRIASDCAAAPSSASSSYGAVRPVQC